MPARTTQDVLEVVSSRTTLGGRGTQDVLECVVAKVYRADYPPFARVTQDVLEVIVPVPPYVEEEFSLKLSVAEKPRARMRVKAPAARRLAS